MGSIMKNEQLPKRRKIRLSQYDYSSNGLYFITICTKNRKRLLSEIQLDTATIPQPPKIMLTIYGRLVEDSILRMETFYPEVRILNYVVMPNHVHLLLFLYSDKDKKSPSVSQIIQQFKGAVTKQAGFPIWQSRFYDHVVRLEKDLQDIVTYIENNPARWAEDEYF